jgi:hypothetical protein
MLLKVTADLGIERRDRRGISRRGLNVFASLGS